MTTMTRSGSFSHPGMPAVGALTGGGRWPLPAGADGGCGGNRRRPGLGADGDRPAGCGTASTIPGRITPASGPMRCRLAAYSASQPPGTASAAAMRQGVPGHYRVPGWGRLAGQHQHGTGMDEARVGADQPPVGRVKSRPAAAHA